MRDTSVQMEKKVIEMIQKKSPNQRLEMGCSMMATSKQLIIRAILENDSNISQTELKQEFFLKFYGNDFNHAEQIKIFEHLKKKGQSDTHEFPRPQ